MSNSFTPLTTIQGMSVAELNKFVAQRDVIIWGGGHLGRVIKQSIEKYGLSVKYFCDSNPKLQGKVIDDVSIISPTSAIEEALKRNAILIIASILYRDDIQSHCHSAGLKLKTHYILYLHISRPEAQVEISDKSNSPMSSPINIMQQHTYEKVLNKLLSDLPLLSHIRLSAWGDPMLNPELPKIIELTEKKVPCTIMTNLHTTNNLRAIINASPSQFVVTIDRSNSSPKDKQCTFNMQTLDKNLNILSNLIKEIEPSTEFKVMYLIYQDNQGKEQKEIKALCSNLGLKFVSSMAYLSPYEKILQYCEGEQLSADDYEIQQNLAWNLDQALALSRKDQSSPCLCQRIFPIINWDLSISLCEVYFGPKIADNYLDVTFNDLLKLRHGNQHCRKCQSHSLHRLDIDVLRRRYPTENLFLFERES